MSAYQQALDTQAGPLEIADAIPASVNQFAQQLVTTRVLANALDVRHIPLGDVDLMSFLETTFESHRSLQGAGAWLVWLSDWIKQFGLLTNAGAVSLRMSHSRGPTCPRFHMDSVTVRLIAALEGPGTEWLRNDDVRYLDDGSISQDMPAHAVQQLSPGSIGLFKGAGFTGSPAQGVVHRSPQTQVDRVVMTLDVAA